jgi:hypothetical protein
MTANMNTKIVVRRIGVISMAKIMGVIYSMIGLIVGTVFSLIAVTGEAVGSPVGGSSGLSETMMGIGAIILFPIVCGVAGFVLGLLSGAIYNLAVRIIGGVAIEGVQSES